MPRKTPAEELRRHAALLKALYSSEPGVCNELLLRSDRKIVRILCEIAKNLLCGTVTLGKKHKSKLSRHKKLLRNLIKRGECWKKKKKRILRGGSLFVTALLAPIFSAILNKFLK
jgi:hypothetical protein